MNIHEELKNSSDWQRVLYDRYHQRVLGICIYFLKDREEAKDAAHDVFIKAFRAWGSFEWKCDPLTWIGAIAKHDCFSRMQKVRKNFERKSEIVMEDEAGFSCESETDLLVHRMRLEKLLPSVKGRLKEILHLSLKQGLNQREIAIHLGVSRVAITRRLTRFKRDLQKVKKDKELAFSTKSNRPETQVGRLTTGLKPLIKVSTASQTSQIVELVRQLQAA